MKNLEKLVKLAWNSSRKTFGYNLQCYHPGMFKVNGKWGRYPAISVTGRYCELNCTHCNGRLLESMIPACTPNELIQKSRRLDDAGHIGILITGGCNAKGVLPWKNYIPAIREIKSKTKLHVSIHGGFMDKDTALKLKEAGVDQVLLDIIGDDDTWKKVYRLENGHNSMIETLEAIKQADLAFIPHIVIGLNYGHISGEIDAMELLKDYDPKLLVLVVIMPLSGTPMRNTSPPDVLDISRIFALARLSIPDIPLSLGCARPRRNPEIEIAAIDAGINHIALPSSTAVQHAENRGLHLVYFKTCCSLYPMRRL